MTDAQKLKRKVRERAAKTGESYAAARRHVVAQVDAERTSKTLATAARAKAAPATGTVSEQRCIEKTGHGFDHWFGVLDTFGARQAGHTKAARHLQQDHGVSAWYAQSITVAYERAHGLRELNQLCSGDFQVSVSRVLPVSVETAAGFLSAATERSSWLEGFEGSPAAELGAALDDPGFRTVKGGRRLRYRPEDTVVEFELREKPDGRSTVVVRHTKIGQRETVESLREVWRELLDAFRAHCARA